MKASEDKELKKKLQSVFTIAHFGKRFLSPIDINQITAILDEMNYHKDTIITKEAKFEGILGSDFLEKE